MNPDNGSKPTTHQKDLAKLPPALRPLIERPQWCVWRWTRLRNGHWQKPPFQAKQPNLHGNIKDPSTWSDYETALATVQAGNADGITYMLTADDPFAAIDLDHCRDPKLCSIDIWAQNFLDTAKTTYAEITPSGDGLRIWGLADGKPVNTKFTLVINDKDIAVELFRHTGKALTITGAWIANPRGFSNVDRCVDWGLAWGKRRKAEIVSTVATSSGNGFDSSGCKYSLDEIETLVQNGVQNGGNNSNVFHSIVGHYLGCGWTPDQITEHMAQYPNGIGSRYIDQDRLAGEVIRSASKYASSAPWEAPAEPVPSTGAYAPIPQPEPLEHDDDLEEDEPGAEPDEDDSDLDEDDPDEEEPANSTFPQLHAHGEPDPRPLREWLVKGLIPKCGHGLLSGQYATGKTFLVFDLFGAIATGQPFVGHTVKRQCGMCLIVSEGANEVRLRLNAVVQAKCGGMNKAPVVWYETTPMLLHKGTTETLKEMARQADDFLQQKFGLPLGLIVVDTLASCAGYMRAGDENDPAVGQAVMNVLRLLSQATKSFVLGVDHFGKSLEAGTRGASSKEASADVVLAALGRKELGGAVIDTRLAVRKNRGGKQGQEYPFALRVVEAPELDEDGEPLTTMIIDWLPPGAAVSLPPDDPWLEGCRQEEQRVGMSRLKRVLLEVLADHGIELPLPSTTRVNNSPPIGGSELLTRVVDAPEPPSTVGVNSSPSIGGQVLTGSVDAPTVRMVTQEVVREAFYACTPEDTRQTLHIRFTRARDRAERIGLIRAANIDGITYLWLLRQDGPDED